MDERTVKKLLNLPPASFKESFKGIAVGLCKMMKAGRTFTFEGRDYPYLCHPYNLTWRNERSVEVPIAMELLRANAGNPVLEVGNVLPHYSDTAHDVLDKYESAPGVINADAVDFDTERRYGLIISISTLEHIGKDEEPQDAGKPLDAIKNLLRLLAPGGRMVATVPLGLNPELDRLLLSEETPFGQTLAMRRATMGNTWRQVSPESVAGVGYSRLGFRATAILIASNVKGQA